MKRFSYFTLLSAVALAVSCEVSEPIRPHDGLIPFNGVGEAAPEWSEFIFTSDGEESSKTVHTNSTIYWSGGDAIRMGYTVNGYWQGTSGNASQSNPAKLYASNSLSEGGATASFTVPGQFTGSASGEYKFYTVYPASAAAEDCTSAPSTVVTIPTEQTPAATSFDPAADLMIGHSVRTYSSRPSEAIPLQWERKVALGEITLKNFSGITGFSTDETIQSITLTAQSGAALTGAFTADLTSPKGALTPSDASNSVTVSGTNLSWGGTDAEPKLTFWIGILPVSITSLDVTLVTDKATYTKSFSGFTRVFAVNTRNQLGIKMTGATRTEKNYKLVTSATADWTGDYVLARTNSGTTYAMGGKSGTNDFSSVSTVTVTNDMISLTQGGPLNIRIDKSTNGYTIKFGNLYLGYTSDALSGSNCLYYSSTFSASKYEWTISLLDENYVEIKNVYNTSRTLRFNSNQKDRFACYNGSQWYPNLYRLGQPAGGDTPPDPQPEATATVTTEVADNIVQTSATLNGSFSGATGTISEVGFYWGTSNNNLSTRVVVSNTTTSPFTYELTGLTPNTTYYFKAFVKEYDGVQGSDVEITSSVVQSFTTEAGQQSGGDYELVTASQSDWSGAYVLANSDAKMMLNGVTTIGTVTAVTITNNKIANSAGSPYEITIAKSGNYYYTLYLTGVGYLGWTSGNSLSSASSAGDNSYKWSISYSGGSLTIANAYDSARKLQYNSKDPRFACYTSSQKAPELFKRAGGGTSDPEVAVMTGNASSIGNTEATLNGSYTIPSGSGLTVTERGFYWGTSSNSTPNQVQASGSSTSFSKTVSGFTAGTTYYYKAYVKEKNSSNVITERIGEVIAFTTTGGSQQDISNRYIGCYEVPAVGAVSNYAYGNEVLGYSTGGSTAYTTWRRWDTSNSKQKIVTHTFYNDNANATENKIMRSYTLLQDKDKKCALWVACAMNSGAYPTGASRSDNWAYDPALSNDWQANLTSGYQNKNGASYDRGHQIGSAYRASTLSQRKMTCYFTNMTPQLSSLNQGNWNTQIEEKVRALGNATSGNDTLYVVSGPLFIGTYDTVNDASGTPCARPTHYYQCFMKVHFNNGVPQSAKGAAYLIEHTASATAQYKTIDYIESLAGFDFFANVPASVQNTAEATATPYSDF